MTLQAPKEIVLLSQVSLEYGLVFGARTEDTVAPSDCAHSSLVTLENSKHFTFGNVPYLNIAIICTN